MKTTIYVFLFLLIAITIASCTKETKVPVKIIFDTDMGPDFDDVGAITVLHALAAKGECEILACCASDAYPTIAPTIEAFNSYFGKPEIPVGAAVATAPDFSCSNHWNDSIVAKFLDQPKNNADYSNAVELYRKVLSAQNDNSVTIVTVGFMSNLAELLQSKPDEYSSLSGLELVKKKVKNWVAMAGKFPEGGEFNVHKDAKSAEYVFMNWPTPILFSGFEIGNSIFTGRKVADNGSVESPVSWAYKYNLDTYEKEKLEKRKSWDQTAVLCAVRNPENYFYVNGPGTFVVNEKGVNKWNPDVNSSHYFLSHKYPYQQIADIIDDMMMFEPTK